MPSTAPLSINKSELIRLARAATKAAIYPYKTAEESVRKPSFFKQPRPSAITVFSSDIYSTAQTLEIQSELKKMFQEELYAVLTSLHDTNGIAGDLERATQNSKLTVIAESLYQEVMSKNDGKTPIFKLFYRKIFEQLGEPYLNTLDRSAKASIILFGLGLLLLTAAIAGSFLSAPFATVIAPLVLCGFSLIIMGITIQCVKDITNSSQAENDLFILPKIVTPAEIVYPEELNPPIGEMKFL